MSDTLGRYLLNEAIPVKYRTEGTLNKKQLHTNMLRLAKDDPETYVKTITKVKKVGDWVATSEGLSVGLDDIAPMYAARDAIMQPAFTKLKAAATRDERKSIILDTQDKMLAHAMTHPGTMGDMARAGARGNALQLMRAVGAPAAASDEHDEVQPWMTVHSYSEGLRPSEWWATNREARMAAVKTNIEVTEPGDLSKILVNNTSSQVVTRPDCETTNGLLRTLDSPDILDRFLAKATSGFPANTLITAKLARDLKKRKVASVIVRSPMTCEAEEGVCQKCMGLTSTGVLNRVGDNVGIRASQSLGEPLTQLALDAKHGVRMSGDATEGLGGLEGFRSILESPSSFKNKAALAPVDGVVTAVAPAPQGGFYITVGASKTYVATGLTPKVVVGDSVHRGDSLSSGVPKPNEVVGYKGLGAGREYVVSQLSDIYSKAGINVDRRHFEVLAKSTLNHMKVDDIDDATSSKMGIVRGDIIDYNKYRSMVSKNLDTVPLAQAEGRYLGEGVLHHVAGTEVTAPMVSAFRRAGLSEIKVTVKAPLVTPFMSPATRNPLLNPDWLVRLGHRYLKQSILEGATQGQSSRVHSVHPIPGIVFGEEFGEGTDGKY